MNFRIEILNKYYLSIVIVKSDTLVSILGGRVRPWGDLYSDHKLKISFGFGYPRQLYFRFFGDREILHD